MNLRSEHRMLSVAASIAEAAISASPPHESRARLLEVVGGAVGFDIGSLTSGRPGEPLAVCGQNVSEEVLSQGIWRYTLETPQDVLAALARGFVRDVDVVDTRTRDRAAVYQEIHKPARVRVFVERCWTIDGVFYGIGLSRCSSNFPDRALHALNLLYPHIAVAMRVTQVSHWTTEVLAAFCDDYGLSYRKREITALLVRGMRNAEIGRLLGISPNTVRNCISEIYRQTQVTNRSELTFLASTHVRCGPGSGHRERQLLTRLDRFAEPTA